MHIKYRILLPALILAGIAVSLFYKQYYNAAYTAFCFLILMSALD